MTEGRVRAIAAQVAAAIAAKIKPSVSEEQIRSDVEAVIRQMQENGELTGSDLTDEQIAAVQENAEAAAGSATTAANAAQRASTAAENAGKAQTAAESAKSTAAQKATDATNAAQTATSKATEAAEANAAAQTAKGEAQTAATNAGKSATAASESAANAEASEEAAATSESNAAKSATAAAGSATTASNAAAAAQAAQGKAETAQAAAESAKSTAAQKATDATNAAQTATSKATEASESATAAGTAKTAAEEAAARAEEAANRLLGMAVVGEIETTDGQTSIVLTGDLAPGTYTFAYLIRKSDGTTETVTIGTYTVEDESETKTYTITWVNYDGTVLETDTVTEGDTPTYDGATPTRAEDSEYTYAFKGWDKTVVAATADATYTATYTQTAKPAEPVGPTNYANPSDAMWQVNNRLATAYGNGKTDGGTGHILTNFVPAKLNDEIYVTGLDLKAYADGKPAAVGIYTNNTDPQTDYQKIYTLTGVTGTANVDGAGDKVTATTANGVTTYVYKILEKNDGTNLADSNTAYIRIDGVAIEGVADSAIVINVKRDGEWL